MSKKSERSTRIEGSGEGLPPAVEGHSLVPVSVSGERWSRRATGSAFVCMEVSIFNRTINLENLDLNVFWKGTK